MDDAFYGVARTFLGKVFGNLVTWGEILLSLENFLCTSTDDYRTFTVPLTEAAQGTRYGISMAVWEENARKL